MWKFHLKMFVNIARLDIGQLFIQRARRGYPYTLDTILVLFLNPVFDVILKLFPSYGNMRTDNIPAS